VSAADGGLPIVDNGAHGPRGLPLPRRRSYALRVSVLDACNLRCTYCAPGSLSSPMQASRWLGAAEHAALAPHFAAVGVRKVRFTGGEPLLRPDLHDVVAAWRQALPTAELALTTNGTRLLEQARSLRAAGIDRVTVHLDTLRRDRYQALMGKGSPEQVQEGIAVALRTFDEVKLNVVVQRGKNDDELADFLRWSTRTGVQVRFIELMRTGSANDVVDDVFMAGREVVQRLGALPRPRREASDPAALFERDGVVFGVIASDTESFCSACDRLRLTADGRLRGCLYESGGVPLGEALRHGASRDDVAALVVAGVNSKRSFHPSTTETRVPFSMADVGG
jgi:cyclic pyranopterin phosphate synthase